MNFVNSGLLHLLQEIMSRVQLPDSTIARFLKNDEAGLVPVPLLICHLYTEKLAGPLYSENINREEFGVPR